MYLTMMMFVIFSSRSDTHFASHVEVVFIALQQVSGIDLLFFVSWVQLIIMMTNRLILNLYRLSLRVERLQDA